MPMLAGETYPVRKWTFWGRKVHAPNVLIVKQGARVRFNVLKAIERRRALHNIEVVRTFSRLWTAGASRSRR
jgi:hypothetical protein